MQRKRFRALRLAADHRSSGRPSKQREAALRFLGGEFRALDAPPLDYHHSATPRCGSVANAYEQNHKNEDYFLCRQLEFRSAPSSQSLRPEMSQFPGVIRAKR